MGIQVLTSFEKAERIRDMDRVACGTAGIIRDDGGDILLIGRTGAHGEGTWSVPGGWVEAGEHPERTIMREIWEEVGLTVTQQPRFVGYTFDRHPERIEDVCLWFEIDEWEGHARVAYPDRIAQIGWFDIGEFPDPLFFPLADAIARGIVK